MLVWLLTGCLTLALALAALALVREVRLRRGLQLFLQKLLQPRSRPKDD